MDGHAYKQRKPRESAHFQLVEDHFETLERIWEERYLERYGFWRSHYMRVIWEYLDCGDLKNGFARIRCADCGHEYLLPFSCKRRHFCPSCHERRVLEFGEFLVSEVLADVPHRQWVFSIPKMLRPWFMRDRKLLGEMCAIVWKLLSRFIKAETDGDVKEVLPAKKLTSISWARLIAKVYLENPLICPRCKGQMRIIACIEEDAVIAKILRHRGLWELPVAHAPPPLEFARIAQMDNTPDDYSELLPSEYEYEAC